MQLIGRNWKYTASAAARPVRVDGLASRSTFPKYASASAGCISRSGRPNQSRIGAKWFVSLPIVLSASPAGARASTNPASTSVSKPARSSALADSRCSRRSLTSARAIPHPSTSPQTTHCHLECDDFTEAEKDQNDSPAADRVLKSRYRPDRGWKAAIGKLTNPGTVA